MRSIDKYTKSFGTLSVAALLTLLSGCGGGGDSSSSGSAGTTATPENTTTTTQTNAAGEVISTQTTGIDVPSEISAVPAQSSSTQASFLGALMQFRANAAAASDLGADTDYKKEKTNVYVEERALEQFEIIEQVFGALAQTKYADTANVNAGPYVAMVSWEANENGKDIKQLQRWTVESRMIKITNMPSDVTGNTTGDVNKLLAWIPERDRSTGEEELVKAEFLIYTAPTTAADGSLLNYGEWDMNVLMGASTTGVDTIPADGANNFFAASARIGEDGSSTLRVHDRFTEAFGDMSFSEELRGILVRNGDVGYGSVSYPDWDACFSGGPGGEGGDGGGDGSMDGGDPGMGGACANGIPTNEANYAYNAKYLAVQQVLNETAQEVVYKDRNRAGAIHIVHGYELYHADDSEAGSTLTFSEGDNIRRHRSFGFPVTFESTAEQNSDVTFDAFAFYGAWQGRHQLWGPGNSITATTDGTDGTTLTRADVPPNQTAPEYKLKEFNGTFTMRALVDADLEDIEGIAVETWLNDHFELFYVSNMDGNTATNDAGWYYCQGELDWENYNPGPNARPNCLDRATDTNIGYTALAGADNTLGTSDDDNLVGELAVGESERRWVNINYCNANDTGGDPGSMDVSDGGGFSPCKDYVYLPSAENRVAGFYEAEWGQNGLRATSAMNRLAEADGVSVNVNLGGSIYVAYTGDYSGQTTTTGWVAKELTGFDRDTWTPTFSSNGDRPFTPERGQEYYMNANGQNYVVTRIEDNTENGRPQYVASLELQTAANPRNTNSTTSASILPQGTAYLAMPWDQSVKLKLVENPADTDNYLLLTVFEENGQQPSEVTVYSDDTWGLTAFSSNNRPLAADGTELTVDQWGWVNPDQNGGKQPVQFNYEYVGSDGDSWGKQQFLVSASDITNFIILDDPINLVGVELYDNLENATNETVSLQYDGWMHGMPDLYRELERNNWTVDASIGGKVRRLLPGQEVSDTAGNRYFVKPMDVSLFLGIVGANTIPEGETPDISQADSVDLGSVPDYTPHNMGAAPTKDSNDNPIQVKYSEGIPLS